MCFFYWRRGVQWLPYTMDNHWGLCPNVNWPRHSVDQSSSLCTVVKSEWSRTSIPPHSIMTWCFHRNIVTFTSPCLGCPFYCVPEHGIFIAQIAYIHSDIPWQFPHSGTQQKCTVIAVSGFSEDIRSVWSVGRNWVCMYSLDVFPAPKGWMMQYMQRSWWQVDTAISFQGELSCCRLEAL